MSAERSALTSKQEQFALVRAIPGITLTAAYRAAYNAKNMAPSTIWAHASRLAASDKVAARIAELRAEAARLANIDAQQVLEKLARVAFTDITEVVSWDDDGKLTLTPSAELSLEGRAAIKSIKRDVDGDITIEMRDPIPSAIAIGKHLGMFPTRVEQTGKDGGPIDIEIKALVAIFDAVGLTPEQEAALDRLIEPQGDG